MTKMLADLAELEAMSLGPYNTLAVQIVLIVQEHFLAKKEQFSGKSFGELTVSDIAGLIGKKVSA